MSEHFFSRRSFLRGCAAAGAAAVAAPRIWGAEARSKRPNVLMLLTDDQRWDTLGCMGNPIIQTPNVDSIAARGTLFRNNFVTTAICMSSRASIFTGLYARCHGIDDFN